MQRRTGFIPMHDNPEEEITFGTRSDPPPAPPAPFFPDHSVYKNAFLEPEFEQLVWTTPREETNERIFSNASLPINPKDVGKNLPSTRSNRPNIIWTMLFTLYDTIMFLFHSTKKAKPHTDYDEPPVLEYNYPHCIGFVRYWFSVNREVGEKRSRFMYAIVSFYAGNKIAIQIFCGLVFVFLLWICFFTHTKTAPPKNTVIYLDSKNRIVHNPLFYAQSIATVPEPVAFYDTVDEGSIGDWMKKVQHSTVKKAEIENGFFTTMLFHHDEMKNVSLELLHEKMKRDSQDERYLCVSAYNYGIPKNIVYSNTGGFVFMLDPEISEESSKMIVGEFQFKRRGNDGKVQIIKVDREFPELIIVKHYREDGYIGRTTLKDADSGCVFQFINIHKAFTHH